jgi:sulfatase maturation enzyme AslB (radical SAM superfamily)
LDVVVIVLAVVNVHVGLVILLEDNLLNTNKKYIITYLNLDGKCNLNCKYCYAIKKISYKYNRDKFLFSFKYVIDKINDLGRLTKVCCAYSEPFMSMDLLNPIAQYLELRNLSFYQKNDINITTNGTFLGDKDIQYFLTRYKDLVATGLCISIDGYKDIQEINRPGSWDLIVKNWDFLREYQNDAIKVNSVIYEKSMDNLADSFIKMITELPGIKTIKILNDKMNSMYKEETLNKYFYNLEKILDYSLTKGLNINFHPITNMKLTKATHMNIKD